ncbi:MAG: DUF3604 domain-containing protein [Burkholderiales bacterium]|nr:MAG: DUF3604 domain-containing protein [Burkholderiales bacterium]
MKTRPITTRSRPDAPAGASRPASIVARRAALLAIPAAVLAACLPQDRPVGSAAPASTLPGTGAAPSARPAAPARPAPNPDRSAYFGDLHLHSSWSADAFALATRLSPEDAHRWARGDTLQYRGNAIRRKAPLDFLALTDHSEYLGVIPEAADPNGAFAGTDWNRQLNDPNPMARFALFRKLVQMAGANQRIDEFEDPKMLRSVWQRYAAVADRFDDPGRFTAFVAFEWTSAPGNLNLHRCVIFRGAGPALPFTSLDSQDPEKLWNWLDLERAQGRPVIAIPHNGNISGGRMFDAQKTASGAPITRAWAERRMANEPLFEMVQEKGSSDTHPTLSPNDEFADFETYNFLLGTRTVGEFRTGSYLRQAYGVGQEIAERIGANPFRYGIEAGTDNHAGMSSTEEFNFQGPHGNVGDRRAAVQSTADDAPVFNSPGGLTGVWAEENTRAALFDAMQRKETFGTSGVRIRVRFFGGWSLPSDLTSRPDWVRQAYASGVPMGGDLPARPAGAKAPTFAIHAVKDPDSGNLDRVQVIKVSTRDGRSTEQVFDALWSGARRPDPKTGKLPDVGSTVDVARASYTNTIGSVELIGTWTDPSFDEKAQATYYLRVLEIPTPRWSTHWAVESGVTPPPNVPATLRERAWTSPIWYGASVAKRP